MRATLTDAASHTDDWHARRVPHDNAHDRDTYDLEINFALPDHGHLQEPTPNVPGPDDAPANCIYEAASGSAGPDTAWFRWARIATNDDWPNNVFTRPGN